MGMAQKIQTLFVDDLDGSEAEGTVRFGLDGSLYEIDLNAVHAKELRSMLAPYARAGRKVTGAARRLAGHKARRLRTGSAPTRYATGPRRTALRLKIAGESQPTGSSSSGRPAESKAPRPLVRISI